MPIPIVLADDHTLFREMLREVLPSKDKAYAVIGEAADGAETLKLVTLHHPDLLLLDYKMPDLGRLSTFCMEVKRQSPTTRILILSGYMEDEIALEAAVGGAQGYILKGTPIGDLLTAIATIHEGGIWVDPHLPPHVFHTFICHEGGGKSPNLAKLSRQELNILFLVLPGMNNKEIGVRLNISQRTVKNHLTHIFDKLGVVSRREAVRYFLAKKKTTR